MPTERPDVAMLSNPGSDRVRSVRRLSGRSARLRAGRFVAEGPQAVREALDAGRGRELYVTAEAADRHPALVATGRDGGVPTWSVTPQVLAAMADTVTPQGLLAVCDLVGVPLDQV